MLFLRKRADILHVLTGDSAYTPDELGKAAKKRIDEKSFLPALPPLVQSSTLTRSVVKKPVSAARKFWTSILSWIPFTKASRIRFNASIVMSAQVRKYIADHHDQLSLGQKIKLRFYANTGLFVVLTFVLLVGAMALFSFVPFIHGAVLLGMLMLHHKLIILACAAILSYLPFAVATYASKPKLMQLKKPLVVIFLPAVVVEQPLHISKHDFILLLSIGLCTFLGQQLITRSLTYAKATTLAPMCYASIIFSVLFGWLLWHETLDLLSLIGMLLIIGGGILTTVLSNSVRHIEYKA